jgi:hypothetical protein
MWEPRRLTELRDTTACHKDFLQSFRSNLRAQALRESLPPDSIPVTSIVSPYHPLEYQHTQLCPIFSCFVQTLFSY